MPLKLRFLRNFFIFLNFNLTILSTTFLLVFILSLIKNIRHFVFILLDFLFLIQNSQSIDWQNFYGKQTVLILFEVRYKQTQNP